MKWFRHDSDCSKDVKLDKLLMKYGSEGYGIYWYCIELIAGKVSTENITFEMEHDAEILAYRLKIDTMKVNEILNYCVNLGLFEVNRSNSNLVCMALAKRTDEYMSKNPEIAKMQKQLKLSGKITIKSEHLPIMSDHIILDDTKLDNIKEKKSNKKTCYKYNVSKFVKLSLSNYRELLKEYRTKEDLRWAINKLDVYIDSSDKGKKYTNHKAVLREGNWVFEEWKNKKQLPKQQPVSAVSSETFDRSKYD